MKIVIFVLLAVLVVAVGFVALLPMSMAAGFVSQQVADFKFAKADGSVWDGKLTNVRFGQQKIGDLGVKADFGALITGKAAGKLSLARDGLSGESSLNWPIGGKTVALSNFKLAGPIGTVPGMPRTISAGGGKFTLEMKNLTFAQNACQSAVGEVWTDALAKVNHKGWAGPELRGPVSCQGGKLMVLATGKAATGEDVMAAMNIGPHLDMEMSATVTNTSPAAIEALTGLGFKPEGGALVIRQAIGS